MLAAETGERLHVKMIEQGPASRLDLAEVVVNRRETGRSNGLQARDETIVIEQRGRQYKLAGLHALQFVEQLRFRIRAVDLRRGKFTRGEIDEGQAEVPLPLSFAIEEAARQRVGGGWSQSPPDNFHS